VAPARKNGLSQQDQDLGKALMGMIKLGAKLERSTQKANKFAKRLNKKK